MSPDAHASLMATKPGRPPLHGQCGNFGCALPVKTLRETPRCVHPMAYLLIKFKIYPPPVHNGTSPAPVESQQVFGTDTFCSSARTRFLFLDWRSPHNCPRAKCRQNSSSKFLRAPGLPCFRSRNGCQNRYAFANLNRSKTKAIGLNS